MHGLIQAIQRLFGSCGMTKTKLLSENAHRHTQTHRHTQANTNDAHRDTQREEARERERER